MSVSPSNNCETFLSEMMPKRLGGKVAPTDDVSPEMSSDVETPAHGHMQQHASATSASGDDSQQEPWRQRGLMELIR